MSVLSWLYHCFVFGMEVVLINRYYWGLNMRKVQVSVIFLVLLGAVSSYFLIYTSITKLEYSGIWGVFLAFVLFDIRFINALKYSIFGVTIMSIWDNLVWGTGLLFVRDLSTIKDEKHNLLCGVIAFFLFFIITLLLQYRKNLPLRILRDISLRQSVLLIVGLILANFFFAMLQGFLVGEMTPNLARYAVVCCILAVVFVIFIFFYLIQTIQKKNYLAEVNRIEESYLQSQQNYYGRVMLQDEELRKFRHDIRHHFFVLGRLSEENRIDELKEYIGRLQESGITKSVSYTGHTLIDSLFSQIFQKHIQAEDISFSFHGKIPPTFSLDNSALCILFANAFQNACEELEKQAGNGKFEMNICSDGETFFVLIRNTLRRDHPFLTSVEKKKTEAVVSQRKASVFDTDKKDWKNHGFGTKNMKKVAEECEVELEWWIVDEKWLEVRMGFLQNNH